MTRKLAGRGPTVVMTADAVGGVWNYALTLCRALPECRFVVAVMGPGPGPAQRAAAGALANLALEEGPYRLEWMTGAAADLDAGRDWLARLARRHRADLVHINGYAHARLDTDVPTLAVAHSDVLSWWSVVHGCAAPAEWDCYRDEVIAGLEAAALVAAPSRSVLDDLRRHYGRRLADALVVPNAIDHAEFAAGPKRPTIMAAGRLWDLAKNLSALAQVAPELAWPVEIAGEAAHPESGAVALNGVRMLGLLPPREVAARLSAAAIFAAPARYEPFGLAILEAAASGCALVLGDIASLRENWDGAAAFVRPEDRAELAVALRRLIADPGERARLGKAAQQRARRFSRQAMARRYRAVYAALTAQGARRAVA